MQSRMVIRFRRARSAARWMTDPSARGSEYGTPSSIRSAPLASSLRMMSTVVSRSGSPIVMNGMSAVPPSARMRRNSSSMAFIALALQVRHDRFHVLVAPAGQVDDDDPVPPHGGRHLDRLGDGVGAFQRGDDPFRAAEQAERLERLPV